MLRQEQAVVASRYASHARGRFGAVLVGFPALVLLIGLHVELPSEFGPQDALPAREVAPRAQTSIMDEGNYASTPAQFDVVLVKALHKRKTRIKTVCPDDNPVARRILRDYGAIFIASRKVLTPPVCIFKNQEQVLEFQNKAGFSSMVIGDDQIELQPAAMKALAQARAEVIKRGLSITPRDGAEAARRTYEDTQELWFTRVLPGLDYWEQRGRLSREQVSRLRALPTQRQVAEILELESQGIFFSKDFSKSILYSIAAPGTSQHLSMLALDVAEFEDAYVRQILAAHGWFQTVMGDLPHFTFLGLKEKDLPAHGLRSVLSGDQLFWIPNIVSN